MADNMSLASSSDSDNDGCSHSDEVDNEKEQLLSAGSNALLSGSARDAAEKFKSALNMICDDPTYVTKKMSAVELIIRYALCIAWIKCKEYRDVVKAVESLNQLIEYGHAGKLPAIYLTLARAYFSLNRFKAALEPVEKALKNIHRISHIKQYFWPGLSKAIEETSKDCLKKALLALQKDCGAYRPPDVTCRYDKCLQVHEDHILPSENIYFTDPDFQPFLLLNCEAKCKIAYHDSCWKHLKHERPDLDKPKDFLGQRCPTENCVTTDNDGNIAPSIIIEVKSIGREGFDKHLKSWPISESSRKHSNAGIKRQLKSESTVDKTSHVRERNSVSESNGHVVYKINQNNSAELVYSETIKPEETSHLFEKEVHPESCGSNSLNEGSFIIVPSTVGTSQRVAFPPYQSPLRYTAPLCESSHHYHYSGFQDYFRAHPIPSILHTSRKRCLNSSFPLMLCQGHPYLPPRVTPVPREVHTWNSHQSISTVCPVKNPPPMPIPSAYRSVSHQPNSLMDHQAIPISTHPNVSLVWTLPVHYQQPSQPIKNINLNGSHPASFPNLPEMKQFGNSFAEVRNSSGCANNSGSQRENHQDFHEVRVPSAWEAVVESNSRNSFSHSHTSHSFASLGETIPFFNDSPQLQASFLTEKCTLQAKAKHQRPKEKKPIPDTQSSLLSPGKCTMPKSEQEPSDEEKLSSRVIQLIKARKMNFGYTNDNYVNPELPYYGQLNPKSSSFVEPGIIDDTDVQSAEFVFSYYQSIFENNGPSKIEDLENRWKEEYKQLQLPQSFFDKHTSISKFLLLSQRFAAIDDIIGSSDLLPDMFSKAEVELTESTSFLLFSKVQKPRSKDDRSSPDLILEASKSDKMKSKQFSDRTRLSSTSSCLSSTDLDYCDTSNIEDLNFYNELEDHVDDNQNPIHSYYNNIVPRFTSSSKSQLNATSEPFVPVCDNESKGEVYMSDDDEDYDGSFVGAESEPSKENHYTPLHSGAAGLDESPVVPPAHWSDADNCSLTNTKNLKNSLTSNDMEELPPEKDHEKENLISENFSLKRALSDVERKLKILKDDCKSLQKSLLESSELSHEVESLKLLRERESKQSKALQKTIDALEQKVKAKDHQYKELESKLEFSDATVNDLKKMMDTVKAQSTDHNLQIEKIQKEHAKEINNLLKKLTDEKQTMEKKMTDMEKKAKQQNITLWKEFFDFKVKVIFQTCSNRTTHLYLLKDKMSDTVSPTKSELSMIAKKHESTMRAVASKVKEVQEMFMRDQDLLEKGLPTQLPQDIILPDVNNLPYPLEEAIQLLERPLQSEPAAPRNLYTQAHQLYNNTVSANGTPIPSQAHEQDMEAFPFRPRTPNESYQLWPHSLPSQGRLPSLMQQPFMPNPMFTPLVPSAPGSTNFQNMSISNLTTLSSGFPTPQAAPSSLSNGAAANPFQSIIGSKALSSASQIQSLNVAAAPVIPKAAVVSSATTPSGSTSSSTGAGQGIAAMSKLSSRSTLTSPAGLTPIVPNKVLARKVKSNYDKLMASLLKMFPTHSELELTQALKMAREKNSNTLTSLSHSEIVSRVEDVLNKFYKKQNKQVSMGLEKFAQKAWGAANKTASVEWDGGDQDNCVICHDPMTSGLVETLQCKHAFHKECLRKWFERDRVCPNCRKPSNMQDEFPPLG